MLQTGTRSLNVTYQNYTKMRYCTILDISSCSSYKNINARLLYLHIACNLETTSYDYNISLRRLAAAAGMSLSAVRAAMATLEKDGLITTTHLTTHLTTQPTTHIHLVRMNELQPPNDTPNDTTHDTPNDTQINKQSGCLYTLTDARASGQEWAALAAAELRVSADQSAALFETFFRRQELKGKTWQNKGDCLAHFISWCEKQVPANRRGPGKAISASADDAAARKAEYERQRQQDEATTEREKLWDELQRLKGWRAGYLKKEGGVVPPELEQRIQELQGMFAKPA